jgi:aldose 1-epimerase
MSATVDRETPINMGQHNYFNLCSSVEENYNICNHLLYLDSKSYTETDKDLIPTGKIISTQESEMDFFNEKKIGTIKLDDNYVLEQNNHLIKPAAKLFNPVSNLNLTLWTDQPGIQVYNASSLNLAPKGLNGVSYGNFAGICLEDQKFPDSVNISDFPSIISSPEKPYFHKTIIDIS